MAILVCWYSGGGRHRSLKANSIKRARLKTSCRKSRREPRASSSERQKRFESHRENLEPGTRRERITASAVMRRSVKAN